MKVLPVGTTLGAAVLLCGLLSATVGLNAAGWVVGVVMATVAAALLHSMLVRHRVGQLGPAGRVTATRLVLVCGVAALTAHSLLAATPVAALVGLAAAALVLDAVDGHIARRTGTATEWGARFDMEVDALLIAVLSVQVAGHGHWWVLLIGAMRYAHLAASRWLRWLRRPWPARRFAKVVAATQGVVLVVAASGLVPQPWTALALAAALVLLVESFGRQGWWQWRRRHDPAAELEPAPAADPAALAVVAGAVLWLALTAPPLAGGPGGLLRIPVEGLVLAGLALVLPSRPRRVVAVVLGVAAAALVALRALGAGFELFLDRTFSATEDWSYLPKGVEVVGSSEGGLAAALLVAGALVTLAGLVTLVPWAARQVADLVARQRRRSARAVLALGVVWVLAAAAGGSAGQVAAADSARLAMSSVEQARADARDRTEFAAELRADPYAGAPPGRLLTGLRGKDMLLVWFESYGRVALEHPDYAPAVLELLEEGEARLEQAGYHARSAFLTAPTFGAGSWLSHGTLQSGTWTDGERRYRQLLESDRLSLTGAFGKAGWRTVFTVPANTRDWPEGEAYYGFDHLYDSRNVGYAGPKFGYASMPDQYTLEHLRRTELAPSSRRPVMAEVDLISSHHPWAPLPELVPWDDVGDGSVFNGMPERGESAVEGRADPETAGRLYRESVEYTWQVLFSFLTTYPDPDRVVVIAGDHQPHSFVSGDDPGHDVPVTILAQDPAVVRAIDDWGWVPGLRPPPDAETWRMDEFRDRFLEAYGP